MFSCSAIIGLTVLARFVIDSLPTARCGGGAVTGYIMSREDGNQDEGDGFWKGGHGNDIWNDT
jgi:hypothetical protein